ncbi:hypothetical protein ANCDUO_20105, partial [Ancylostoma duodenale]
YRHLLRVDAAGGHMAHRHTSVLPATRARRIRGLGDGAGAAEWEARSGKNRVRRLGAEAGGEASGLDDRGSQAIHTHRQLLSVASVPGK